MYIHRSMPVGTYRVQSPGFPKIVYSPIRSDMTITARVKKTTTNSVINCGQFPEESCFVGRFVTADQIMRVGCEKSNILLDVKKTNKSNIGRFLFLFPERAISENACCKHTYDIPLMIFHLQTLWRQ